MSSKYDGETVLALLSRIRFGLKEAHRYYRPVKLGRLSETQLFLFQMLHSAIEGMKYKGEFGRIENESPKIAGELTELARKIQEIQDASINFLRSEVGRRREEFDLKMMRRYQERRSRAKDLGSPTPSDLDMAREFNRDVFMPLSGLSEMFLRDERLEGLIFRSLEDIEQWLEFHGYKEEDDPHTAQALEGLKQLREAADVQSFLVSQERERMKKEGADFEGIALDKRKFKAQVEIFVIGRHAVDSDVNNHPPDESKAGQLVRLIASECIPEERFVLRNWSCGSWLGNRTRISFLLALSAEDSDHATREVGGIREAMVARLTQEGLVIADATTAIKEISLQERERGRFDVSYHQF